MPRVENTHSRHAADRRLSRAKGVSASRRSARHPADGARAVETAQAIHVTPNAIMAARGSWKDFAGAKRFARWLTDGATERPHLRF